MAHSNSAILRKKEIDAGLASQAPLLIALYKPALNAPRADLLARREQPNASNARRVSSKPMR